MATKNGLNPSMTTKIITTRLMVMKFICCHQMTTKIISSRPMATEFIHCHQMATKIITSHPMVTLFVAIKWQLNSITIKLWQLNGFWSPCDYGDQKGFGHHKAPRPPPPPATETLLITMLCDPLF